MTRSHKSKISKLVRKVTKRKIMGQMGCADGGASGDMCRAN